MSRGRPCRGPGCGCQADETEDCDSQFTRTDERLVSHSKAGLHFRNLHGVWQFGLYEPASGSPRSLRNFMNLCCLP